VFNILSRSAATNAEPIRSFDINQATNRDGPLIDFVTRFLLSSRPFCLKWPVAADSFRKSMGRFKNLDSKDLRLIAPLLAAKDGSSKHQYHGVTITMNKVTLALASAAFCLAQGAIAAPGDNKVAAPAPGGNPNGVVTCNSTVVADCSFEAGAFGGVWTEASTNFGTPICDVGSCGTGTSTNGFNSGAFWSWFGGIGAFEEGSVSQNVVIPAAATGTLTFYFLAPVCNGDAADFVEVTIDGNQLWSFNAADTSLCGNPGPYTQISVDVSAYVDGASHALEFHSIINGAGGAGSNFFIDDVDLVTAGTPGGPPAPAIDLPSLGTSAMIGLGALLAMFGFVGLRRRRMN
jgi:hypothetical protein